MTRGLASSKWRLFGRDRRAVAAVEFAVILPIMLVIYIGVVDVTRAVISIRKANLVSRTLSDLVAQQSTSTATPSSTIATIFNASTAIMQPFPTDTLTMVVSGVAIQAKSDGTCCDAMVKWSYMKSATTTVSPALTLRTCDTANVKNKLTQTAPGARPSATTIPSAIVYPNQGVAGATTSSVTYVVIADIQYQYKPFFSQAASWIVGPSQKTTYMVPRAATGAVTLATPINAPTGQSGCTSY